MTEAPYIDDQGRARDVSVLEEIDWDGISYYATSGKMLNGFVVISFASLTYGAAELYVRFKPDSPHPIGAKIIQAQIVRAGKEWERFPETPGLFDYVKDLLLEGDGPGARYRWRDTVIEVRENRWMSKYLSISDYGFSQSNGNWIPHYKAPEMKNWVPCQRLAPWRTTKRKAEADLKELAELNDWELVKEDV